MYTPHNFRTGASAYARVGMEIGAMSATPHQLICMLFDGAHTAISMARHYMTSGDVPARGKAISHAISIVDGGLKAALDAKAVGETGSDLVANLGALYDYITQRLLQANLRSDPAALDEADGLLENIASAWREIDAARARD